MTDTFTPDQARIVIDELFSQVPAATDPEIRDECLTDEERSSGDAGRIARAEYLIGLFDNPGGETTAELEAAISALEPMVAHLPSS